MEWIVGGRGGNYLLIDKENARVSLGFLFLIKKLNIERGFRDAREGLLNK